MKVILITMLLFVPILLTGQVGIFFTFANGQITNEAGQLYYEFDVMIAGSDGTTRFGELLALINYNGSAFGTEINANGNVQITPGALLIDQEDFYAIRWNDNQPTRLAILCEFLSANINRAVWLPVIPSSVFHVKIKIQDSSQQTGISYNQTLMAPQQYYANHLTNYNPVTATDTLDETLPVELSSFTANMNNSLTGVNLTWVTQSESNLVGYGIYRGESDDLSQAIDLNAYITATNTSQTQVYIYTDSDVMPEQTYWYWLESREMNGINGFHGPICFSVPQQPVQTPQIPIVTGFQSLYPNPFNPDLNIRYALQDDAQVTMVVCNLKGQIIKQLFNGQKSAGLHSLKWDGRDDQGLSCSSGLYFIRMQAGGRIINRKVMLMK